MPPSQLIGADQPELYLATRPICTIVAVEHKWKWGLQKICGQYCVVGQTFQLFLYDHFKIP